MFYTVYQVTHVPSGKTYIGKHQTNDLDDGYMGSGKRIQNAIKKHGLDQFEKKILHVFDSEEDMNTKEAELVTEEFCSREDTYNLCPGGKGGWGYINSVGKNVDFNEHRRRDPSKILGNPSKAGKTIKEIRLASGLSPWGIEPGKSFKDKKHSKETKNRIGKANSSHMTGEGNSQYGTMWITNDSENRKIRKSEPIPNGWYKGRKMNKS